MNFMTGIAFRAWRLAQIIFPFVNKVALSDMLFLYNSKIEFFLSISCARELYVDIGWPVFILCLQIDRRG